MTRYNFAGQALKDDAPELPGDWEIDPEAEAACPDYFDTQQGVEAKEYWVKLLWVNEWGTHWVRNADGSLMHWTEEEFDLCFGLVPGLS